MAEDGQVLCCSCKYWEGDVTHSLSGECRKDPPIPIIHHTGLVNWWWPIAEHNGWCGHAKLRKGLPVPKEG